MRPFHLALLAVALPAAGCGLFPPECFVAGTKVRTPRGEVSIEHLRVGDEVLSFRTSDGAIVVRKVERLFRAVVGEVREIVVGDVTITTTDEHPFWDAEHRRWVPARELVAGTVLVRLDASSRTLPAIVASNRRERRPETPVYNLTVAGPEHTYFAADVAVHNKSVACTDCPPPPPYEPPDASPASASLSIQDLTPSIEIARTAIDGQKMLSLGAALTRELPARSLTLAIDESLAPAGKLTVVEANAAVTQVSASLVTLVDSGVTYLVVGTGAATLRRVEERLELAPRDAETRVVRVSYVEDWPAGACNGASAEAALRWKAPAPSLTVRTILTQQWNDATSCVAVDFEDGESLSACLPKNIWPFAIGDALQVFPTDRDARRLDLRGAASTPKAGVVLALERGEIFSDGTTPLARVDAYLFLVEEIGVCTVADARCGAVRTPLDVYAWKNGQKQRVRLGVPFGDDMLIERHWLVSAFSEAVTRADCARTEEPSVPARGTVEMVTLITPPKVGGP